MKKYFLGLLILLIISSIFYVQRSKVISNPDNYINIDIINKTQNKEYTNTFYEYLNLLGISQEDHEKQITLRHGAFQKYLKNLNFLEKNKLYEKTIKKQKKVQENFQEKEEILKLENEIEYIKSLDDENLVQYVFTLKSYYERIYE